MACPPLNRMVERSIHGHWVNRRGAQDRSLGKIVRLNCPGKKHISGIGMPVIAVPKII